MTYEEIVKEAKASLCGKDAKEIDGHLAVQIDVIGEGEGAFYVEVKDGEVFVEPYEYYDRDCKLIATADVFTKLISGKLDAVLAYTTGKLRVEAGMYKRDMVTEIAATLAFAAIQNNDKIGAVFFTDRIEKFIPPQKGRKHILYIIRELLGFEAESKQTDITVPLQYLTNAIKKRCTTFLLSDFIGEKDFKSPLTIANRKHDVVAIQVYDKRVEELPDVGLMKIVDAESGDDVYIDTSSRKVRAHHHQWWVESQERLHDTFTKSGVDAISVRTDQDYVKSLMNLFAKRN